MDWDLYDFERHWHPLDATQNEFVAYPRTDERGGWDLFVFAPEGSVPELEHARTDEGHLFVGHADDRHDLHALVERVEAELGPDYERAPYYREAGGRVVIGRLYEHLRAVGAHRMVVGGDGPDRWVLYVRRKDFPLAGQVAPPNVAG